jgi:hypothetical protein
MSKRRFVVSIEGDQVLELARVLCSAAGTPAVFAQPPTVLGGAWGGEQKTWVDGARTLWLDYSVYDEDGRGGGSSESKCSLEGFADGTKLLFTGMGRSLDALEVVHDGGLGGKLVAAAASWLTTRRAWQYEPAASLLSSWRDATVALPLTGEPSGLLAPSSKVVLAEVGARRFAAAVAGARVLVLGPVPAATPDGATLYFDAAEPSALLTAAQVFELALGQPLAGPVETWPSRVMKGPELGGLFGISSSGEDESTQRWTSDGWVLRVATLAGRGSRRVELALQHDSGEPLALFMTVYEGSEPGPRRHSGTLYLHGAFEVVSPVLERLGGWLTAHGWVLLGVPGRREAR